MDGEKCHRKTHEKYEKPVRFLTMPSSCRYPVFMPIFPELCVLQFIKILND